MSATRYDHSDSRVRIDHAEACSRFIAAKELPQISMAAIRYRAG